MIKRLNQGRSKDVSKGGHTVSNIIAMAFSPRNIVGCLLKKGLQRGGHGHPRTPPPPSLRPWITCKLSLFWKPKINRIFKVYLHNKN